MKFELSESQHNKINDWIIKNYPYGLPYTGAAGGLLEYRFFPTSIGTFVSVKNGLTNEELDVTEDL